MHADQSSAAITIRLLGETDAERIAQLAQLDSSQPPAGELLGIEVEGRLLAAVSVEGGELIADPFARSEEFRALLALRAEQLRRHRRDGLRAAAFRRRKASRPALAGSPPGSVDWLLGLPPPR